MTAQEILKLIEEVDPADTAKLDEIDARVVCYLNTTYDQRFVRLMNRCGMYGDGFAFTYKYKNGEQGSASHNICVHYTRSRDALKAIRPEGYYPFQYSFHPITADSFWFCIGGVGNRPKIYSEKCATEELAELHAIIQAVNHDRTTNPKAGG